MSATRRQLFEDALEIPVDLRARWLDENCLDALERSTIERLLRGDDNDAKGHFEQGFDELLANVGEADEPASSAGTRIHSFVLGQKLGEGGSSVVFRAVREQAGVRQNVALKLLRRHLYTPEEKRRFRDERHALSQLDHRGIARLIEGGVTEAGIAYIALELVEGSTILEHVRAQMLDLRTRLKLFVDVCRAVEAAHRALIVHRDLKPSNVLVTSGGDVKLLDFGIAKMLDADPGADGTGTEHHAMTPAYAAPEQFQRGPITTATDVYALGVLLGELLTGHRRPAGDARKPSSLVDSHTTDGLLPATSAQTRRQLAGDLDNIILQATAEEPGRRYASAGALADDIERHLANRPVAAHPPSLLYRARKFVARHRGGVATAAAFLVILIIAAGFALAQADATYRSAERADAMREFMFKAFAEAEPSGPRDGAPRITDVVAQAVSNARADTHMNAQVRSELLTQLGAVLREQGQVEPAREILEWNHGQASRDFGEWSTPALEAGHELAQAMIFAGAFTQARTLIDALLAHAPDGNVRLSADLRFDSALLATKQRELRRAIEDADAGMAFSRRVGSSDALTRALGEYGNVQLAVGDFAGAIGTYTELLAQEETRYGPMHRQVAASHADLSRAYRRKGDVAGAEKHIRAALAIDAVVLPKDDWRLANHLNALMFVLMIQRDYQAALDTANEGLRINRLAYGAEHPEVANDLNSVGMLRAMLGDYAGAKEPLREALRLTAVTWGENHFETALAHSNYGATLAAGGDAAAGRAEIHRALATFAAQADPDLHSIALGWEKLARIALEAHTPDQALSAIGHVQEVLATQKAPRPYWDGRVAALRASALIEYGDDIAALMHLREAQQKLANSTSADAELTVEVALLVASAAQRTQQADAASTLDSARDALAHLKNPPPRLSALGERVLGSGAVSSH